MKTARFDYQEKNKFLITQVMCVHYLFLVLLIVGTEHGNFSLIGFAREAPSLKSAEIQWAVESGKSCKSPCCSFTVNCDTDLFVPASWPFVISECSSSV